MYLYIYNIYIYIYIYIYIMDAISSINPLLLGSAWFTIYKCFSRFLYMRNMSHVTEQKTQDVRIANLHKSTVLYVRFT